MSDLKIQTIIPSQQVKPVVYQAPVDNNKTEIKQTEINSNNLPIDLKDRKITGKKLQLVLYQIAKNDKSVFAEEQKIPIMASLAGVFLTLCSATLINVGQFIIKPQPNKKKWFMILGMGNLLAATFLIGFSVYRLSDMYMKVSEDEWARVQIEKQEYEKLPLKEKRAFLLKQLEQEQMRNLVLAERESQRKQQMIQITK